ncbi:uncharacterized protein LOC144328824 isoform X3 [Podarcis muralis]
MFRSLAWDDSRNCVVNVWKYLMRNHHDDIHVFISQALGYLHHPQVEISHAAARFTVFQEFESSPDPIMVHFAKTYRVVLQKLSVKRRLSGAGEKSTPETKGSSAGKLLSECDSRAPSPMLLPPESPPRPPLLEGTAFLGLESPRRAKRSITQRGKQPTESSRGDRRYSAEAPAGISTPSRRTASGGRKQSPQHAGAHLSQVDGRP